MEFTRKIWICYKVVLAIIVCVWVSGSKGDGESDFKLFRAKQDIFANPECEDKRKEAACQKYGADCHPSTTCRYCRCQKPKNTLIYNIKNKNIERCKRDEEIQEERGT